MDDLAQAAHGLFHGVVDQDVVILTGAQNLFLCGFQLGADLLLSLGGIRAQAALQLLPGGRHDEDQGSIRAEGADLGGAHHIHIQNHVAARPAQLFHCVLGGAVAVLAPVDIFQQLLGTDQLLELLMRHKVVVLAVLFIRPGGPGGHGNTFAGIGMLCNVVGDDGALAYAAGTGNDDQLTILRDFIKISFLNAHN